MPGPGTIRSPLPETTRLHRVGVVRAGIRKVTQKESGPVEYPSATDHFIVNADPSTSQQSADSFHKVYGDEPKQLPITLWGETPEDNLFSAWLLYGGSQLNRKCEGPGGSCSIRAGSGGWVDGPCQCQKDGLTPGETKKKGRGDHCIQRWTLSFLLMDVTGVGVWQFGTNSPIAGDNLSGVLKTLHGLTGSLMRAECILRLVPRTVSPEGRPKTVHVAALEPLGLTPRQAIALAEQLALEPPARGEIPPPEFEHNIDPVLDGPAGQYDVTVQFSDTQTNTHAQLHGVTIPAEAVMREGDDTGERVSVSEVTLSVGQQLRRLEAGDRKRLYEMVGITRGMSPADVEGLLWAKWGEHDLMESQVMDVGYLYAELLKAHGEAE